MDLKAREEDIRQDKGRMEQGRRVEFLLPLISQFESLLSKTQSLEASYKSKQDDYEKLNLDLGKAKENLKVIEEKSQIRLPEIDVQLSKVASFLPLLEQLRARGGSLALAKQKSDLEYSESAWENIQEKTAQLPLLQQADKHAKSLRARFIRCSK